MNSRSSTRAKAPRLTFVAAAVAALLSGTVQAYDFKPAPAEWAMWPDYCKARYVTTAVGKASPYFSMFPAAGVQRWRTLLGTPTFDAVHHYCAGLIWMQRASLATTDQQRRHMLRNAEAECRYTFERIPPTSPIYREVASNLQLARAMLGSYGTPISP
jgi:hypothetical protein